MSSWTSVRKRFFSITEVVCGNNFGREMLVPPFFGDYPFGNCFLDGEGFSFRKRCQLVICMAKVMPAPWPVLAFVLGRC